MSIVFDPNGGVTSAAGFRAGGTAAGIKTSGAPDVGLLVSDRPCAAAAVFTRNRLHAACIDVNRERLAGGLGRAVVVNSGNANASTGERGLRDARRMTELAAAREGLPPEAVFVCSTGVIGRPLDMERVAAGIAAIETGADAAGGDAFARAILTTDLVTKQGAARFGPYALGGCAKGSGMIHPNMATMLAYLATDAPIALEPLRAALAEAADRSFNLITVDGDTSPSDAVILLANGAAGGDPVAPGDARFGEFREALDAVCIHLAKAIARDGEGATKLIEITVRGAASEAEARRLVREIGTSPLVKTAVHGADPNWGRIAGVIGRSDAAIVEEAVTVAVCGHRLFERREPVPFDEAEVSRAMAGAEVAIEVGLGAGGASATGWTCDLGDGYVRINADYTT